MAATVPSFEDVFAVLLAKCQGDAAITAAGIPVISQDDAEYEQKLERALAPAAEGEGRGPGVAFVLWAADGDAGDGNQTGDLALENRVILAVLEHRAHNTTGRASRQWCGHVLRLIHRSDAGPVRGRPSLRVPRSGRVYELGAAEQGLVIYLAHFEVRTFEAVGVSPAP